MIWSDIDPSFVADWPGRERVMECMKVCLMVQDVHASGHLTMKLWLLTRKGDSCQKTATTIGTASIGSSSMRPQEKAPSSQRWDPRTRKGDSCRKTVTTIGMAPTGSWWTPGRLPVLDRLSARLAPPRPIP
jgi:hypothetical protein